MSTSTRVAYLAAEAAASPGPCCCGRNQTRENDASRGDRQQAACVEPLRQSAGFKNLLASAPGTNIATAPRGPVIIYAPVEKQTYSGGVISGHIEIKVAGGYVSDFNGKNPCYRTDAISLKSPLNKKHGITFHATGIWYKE